MGERRTVRSSSRRDGDWCVGGPCRDTGPGIPEDVLPLASSSRSSRPSATRAARGLGLSVSLGIAQAHGGTPRRREPPGGRRALRLAASASRGRAHDRDPRDRRRAGDPRPDASRSSSEAGYEAIGAADRRVALELLVGPRHRARRQRHRHARSLRARAARGGAAGRPEPSGRARHRRRHLLEPQPRRSRAARTGSSIKPFSHGEFLTAVAAALERSDGPSDDMQRAPARPSARRCARERDRGARRRHAWPLRAARRRSPCRVAAQLGLGHRGRSRPSAWARSCTTSARSGSRTASC